MQSERNWVGKWAQATGMTASLRILSSKADSNYWESFTRSELKLESVHQVTMLSHLQEKATKPLLKQKHHQKHLTWAKEKNNWTVAQWSKVFFSDKIKFCFSFGNQSLESEERLERHRIQDAWSPVWSFWSQWWFGVPWRQLVLVHCVLSSPKSIQPSTRRFWSILCLHLLASFMEMLISFFQQDFSTCPQCQKHFQVVCWPWYYCACLARQHAWPEPHLESMGYFQEKDEKQWIQQCRRAEGCATGYCTGKQRHRLIASMPHLTDAGVCAKGAQTKYWVHKLKDFIELELVWLANPFCIDLRKYSNILRYWFLTFMSCKL